MSGETATGASPFDQASPWRPGGPDVNGGKLVMRASGPVDPRKFPTANALNTLGLVMLSLGAVCPVARVAVKFSAGSPAIESSQTVRLQTAQPVFAVVRTTGGQASGDVFVSWTASSFPAAVVRPRAALVGGSVGSLCADYYTQASVLGIRVKTKDQTHAFADLPFALVIY